MQIMFEKPTQRMSLGRNRFVKYTVGLSVGTIAAGASPELALHPITTRGVCEACRIVVPVSHAAAIGDALIGFDDQLTRRALGFAQAEPDRVEAICTALEKAVERSSIRARLRNALTEFCKAYGDDDAPDYDDRVERAYAQAVAVLTEDAEDALAATRAAQDVDAEETCDHDNVNYGDDCHVCGWQRRWEGGK